MSFLPNGDANIVSLKKKNNKVTAQIFIYAGLVEETFFSSSFFCQLINTFVLKD